MQMSTPPIVDNPILYALCDVKIPSQLFFKKFFCVIYLFYDFNCLTCRIRKQRLEEFSVQVAAVKNLSSKEVGIALLHLHVFSCGLHCSVVIVFSDMACFSQRFLASHPTLISMFWLAVYFIVQISVIVVHLFSLWYFLVLNHCSESMYALEF